MNNIKYYMVLCKLWGFVEMCDLSAALCSLLFPNFITMVVLLQDQYIVFAGVTHEMLLILATCTFI